MTGNSLDGADLVVTKIDTNLQMTDLSSVYVPMPQGLKECLIETRQQVEIFDGDMPAVVSALDKKKRPGFFDQTEEEYTNLIADAVKSLSRQYNHDEIDVIGSHGQTCAHCPPSIAKTKNNSEIYTVQIGNGQKLADKVGITVVNDFRSDDLMAGGEAAPLAPIHHQHLSKSLKIKGHFPVAFCNAGNTGNYSVISTKVTGEPITLGWDVGPFNNFMDKLMRTEKNLECDKNGEIANRGQINVELLTLLFHQAVQTKDGQNFLLKKYPKSSDPTWYQIIPELAGKAPVSGQILSFEDRLRTATYFATYIFAHSLSHISEDVEFPNCFALCGGGWKNPLCVSDFEDLLVGNTSKPVLKEHDQVFKSIRARFKKQVLVKHSEYYGFDGSVMEARLFADAAFSRISCLPFSTPASTGTTKESVLGMINYPGKSLQNATANLRSWIDHFGSEKIQSVMPKNFDPRWSRAVRGWDKK